ncbi:MAG: hypothetical protein U0Q55_15015 [Vicinamibacterales bacterium]
MTYVPGALKLAVVAAWAAFANVTVPGPLICVHAVVTVAPCGRPSSVTVGVNESVAGSTTLRWGARLTFGAWLVWPSAPSA